MAENSIDKKTAAQKRTALLALAADRGEKTGECLTPEAMAAFLDGTCSREEKDLALKHISLCQRCYGEWMVLAELQLESGRTRRTRESRPYFLRPANLAAFAAVMAAVVSIGIFLDINPFSYRIDSEPAPPVATMQEESARLPAARDRTADQEAAPPAPARSKEQQLAPPRKSPVSENRTITPATPGQDAASQPSARLKSTAPAPAASRPAAAPPLPAKAERKAETAAPEEMREQAGIQRQISPALPFRQWRQELTAVCRGKESQAVDRILSRKLFDDGKRALPSWQQESPASSADRSLRELILPLLERARDEEHLLDHCREITSAVDKTSE
jgi:hypothetical protein